MVRDLVKRFNIKKAVLILQSFGIEVKSCKQMPMCVGPMRRRCYKAAVLILENIQMMLNLACPTEWVYSISEIIIPLQDVELHKAYCLKEMAKSYQACNKYWSAEKYYQKSIQIEPFKASTHWYLGKMLFFTMRYSLSGLKHLKEAYVLKPEIDPYFKSYQRAKTISDQWEEPQSEW